MDRERGFRGHGDHFAVQHRQRAGQPQADRAGVRIRRVPEPRRARTEYLRLGLQLDVNFEADHRFVFGANFVGKWHSADSREDQRATIIADMARLFGNFLEIIS